MSSGVRVRIPEAPLVRLSGGEAPVIRMEMSQGVSGPRGTWEVDQAFQLRQQPLLIDKGQIEIDFSEANTYYVLMTESITRIRFKGLPQPGVSVRVQLYLEQDAVGSRLITGWPEGTQTPQGIVPILTPDPGALDSIVLDTFDGGATIQLNVVGRGYLPLATPVPKP